MRDEATITAELNALTAEHHERSAVENEAQLRARTDKIGVLRTELKNCLSAGAKPCPRCEAKAIGIHKTSIPIAGGDTADVYEVGCPTCTIRARGGSVEKAVANWNAGKVIGEKLEDGTYAKVSV